MLTEDNARVLLHEAAATVEVAAGTDLAATVRHDRRRLRVLAAAAAVAAVVAAGTGLGLNRLGSAPSPLVETTTDPTLSSPAASETPPTDDGSTERTAPKVVSVPILMGYTQREAVRRVEERGLRAEVSVEPAACIPEGEVTGSVPVVGTDLEVGSQVVVVVSGGGSAGMPSDKVCTGGIASQHDRAIAQRLLEFAASPNLSIAPFAPVVRLGLGEQLYQEVVERDLQDPRTWRICAAYAERSCPMSAIATLDQLEDVTVNALRDPENRCFAGDPPPELAGQRVIRIEPVLPRDASCISYASVDVYSSEVGQVTAIVLRLGSP